MLSRESVNLIPLLNLIISNKIKQIKGFKLRGVYYNAIKKTMLLVKAEML